MYLNIDITVTTIMEARVHSWNSRNVINKPELKIQVRDYPTVS